MNTSSRWPDQTLSVFGPKDAVQCEAQALEGLLAHDFSMEESRAVTMSMEECLTIAPQPSRNH